VFRGEASLPAGLRVYAVGDVHGRADCLTELLERIESDLAESPVAESRVIMLGDYTDRGPQSRQVVEMLAARAEQENMVCLRGNHDDWFLRFLTDPDEGDGFLNWGGIQTLESYGVDLTGAIKSNAELARELTRLVPLSHRRFLSRLRYWHEEGDYFFCHAGVRPGIALHFQDPHDLMWIRGEFHAHKGSFGKVVVHGHTPQASVDFQPNRINIDTRAFDTGVLTALVLEGNEQRLIQTWRA
jgi:serine/threonine protein phosphatase 1